MYRKWRFALPAAAVLTSLALAGCGDDDKDTGVQMEPTASSTPDGSADEPGTSAPSEPSAVPSPSNANPPDGGSDMDLSIGGELEGTWVSGDTSLTSRSAQLTYRSAETGECTGVATDRDIALTSCDSLDMADPNAFGAMSAVWSVNGDRVTVKWLNGRSEELTRQ